MAPLLCALLVAAGLWLLLSRSWLSIVFGLALLGHAANLFILAMGGLTVGRAPIIPSGASVLNSPTADPIPQALILTAIVIGFGMQALLLVLFSLAARGQGGDTDELAD